MLQEQTANGGAELGSSQVVAEREVVETVVAAVVAHGVRVAQVFKEQVPHAPQCGDHLHRVTLLRSKELEEWLDE